MSRRTLAALVLGPARRSSLQEENTPDGNVVDVDFTIDDCSAIPTFVLSKSTDSVLSIRKNERGKKKKRWAGLTNGGRFCAQRF